MITRKPEKGTAPAETVDRPADSSASTRTPVRRLPYVVYLTSIAIVVTAFLLEISRGQCPVP